MWTTQYEQQIEAPAAAIWAALRDLHSGVATGPNSDSFALHGPFAIGTELSVTPQGQDTFRSVIVEMVENEVYADRTSYEGLTLLFRHRLVPSGAGTLVSHELEIDGPAAAQVGPELGPQISGDFPLAMAELAAAAVARTASVN